MTLTLAEELKLEGKAEGKAEGTAEAIITVLTTRFGPLPASLEKKIRSVHAPAHLGKLLECAAICQSLAEFKKKWPGSLT